MLPEDFQFIRNHPILALAGVCSERRPAGSVLVFGGVQLTHKRLHSSHADRALQHFTRGKRRELRKTADCRLFRGSGFPKLCEMRSSKPRAVRRRSGSRCLRGGWAPRGVTASMRRTPEDTLDSRKTFTMPISPVQGHADPPQVHWGRNSQPARPSPRARLRHTSRRKAPWRLHLASSTFIMSVHTGGRAMTLALTMFRPSGFLPRSSRRSS